jgi:hypothetical protein
MPRLGARRPPFGGRKALVQHASRQRGRGVFNIWYHYSPKLERDVVLRSDVELAHFYWLEGDPAIKAYELEPAPSLVAIGDQPQRTQFDALVHFYEGRPQLREVKTDDTQLDVREQHQREAQEKHAHAAGFDYLRVTRTTLETHQQLIQNWSRALPFIAACRAILLDAYLQEVAATLRRSPQTTIAGVLLGTNPDLRPIYLAAIFRSLQQGWLSSDLADQPLCAQTQLWLRGSRNG